MLIIILQIIFIFMALFALQLELVLQATSSDAAAVLLRLLASGRVGIGQLQPMGKAQLQTLARLPAVAAQTHHHQATTIADAAAGDQPEGTVGGSNTPDFVDPPVYHSIPRPSRTQQAANGSSGQEHIPWEAPTLLSRRAMAALIDLSSGGPSSSASSWWCLELGIPDAALPAEGERHC
jgi:hypothetical protein